MLSNGPLAPASCMQSDTCADSQPVGIITPAMGQMTLEINGEIRTLPPVDNLRELLVQLGIGEDRIAVEVNRRIIRRRDWEAFRLSERDRIEIVQFVGGG